MDYIVLPIIIGTAGHIDHGKTQLVRALTGIDTDRLKDEKQRGMSIELGYAYLDIPSDDKVFRVGIIDVPGHIKFIKTMVQGTASIDFLILVIDALQGIQEQTIEHYDIARLLRIDQGLVVITKTSKADRELIYQRQKEAEKLIESGSFNKNILTVDSVDNSGMDELKGYISAEIMKLKKNKKLYPSRLDIDRIFSKKGHGIIVTGTCSSGRFQKNQEIMVLNSKKKAVIKNIQIHNLEYDAVEGGQRAALNLKNISGMDLKKGDTLSKGDIGFYKYLYSFIGPLQEQKEKIGNKKVKFLYKARTINSVLQQSELKPEIIRIKLQSPAYISYKDRFILRNGGNDRTIAGGHILLGSDRSISVNNKEFLSILFKIKDESKEQGIIYYIREYAYYINTKELLKLFSMSETELDELIKKTDDLMLYKGGIIHRSIIDKIFSWIKDLDLSEPMKEISQRDIINILCKKGYNKRIIIICVDILIKNGLLKKDKSNILICCKEACNAEVAIAMEKIVHLLEKDALILELDRIFDTLKINNEIQESIYKQIITDERFIIIDKNFIILAKKMKDIETELINFLKENNAIRATEFKTLIRTTRKYAIPLLEYLDKKNITLRRKDVRYLNQRIFK